VKTVLHVEKLTSNYECVQVLWDVSFDVNEKEIVTIIGPNGAGKSTVVKTITGLCPPSGGEITFNGDRIDRMSPYKIARKGISLIPETRDIFPRMTVMDNLLLGTYVNKDVDMNAFGEWIFQLFPVLKTKSKKMARTLSGGEQQMLAIGRGLMSLPELLMLDEPSLGLSPILVKSIFKIIKEINQQGTTILLVEQNVFHSLTLSHRGYVLENGSIVLGGSGQDLLKNQHIRQSYLGL
jgi:branched-chain amino acid transport system ATP-binding protein